MDYKIEKRQLTLKRKVHHAVYKYEYNRLCRHACICVAYNRLSQKVIFERNLSENRMQLQAKSRFPLVPKTKIYS